MDYYNENSSNIKGMNHSRKSNYLKKIIQILLSVSVFSFFFSQSSLVPVLVDSYDYLVSNFNFKFKLFTYTTERNCIFLLCNGILVLIIQSSGVISKITPVKSASRAGIDDHDGEKGDDQIGRFQQNEKKGIRKAEILEEKMKENGGHDMGREEDSQIEKWEEEEEEEKEGGGEEEDDEGINNDELTKMFEDFIKKKKQEFQGA